DGNVRKPPPRPLPDQREERTREDARLRNAARTADVPLRFVAGVDAGELERRIGLDRDGEVWRPLEPDRPRAVGAPARQQLVRHQPVRRRIAQAEKVEQEEMLRDHHRVRLELAFPPAVGMLERQQPLGGALDTGVEGVQLLYDGHAATLVVTSDNSARAALRPERTALSIVAGQPVPVHAPPRARPGRTRPRPGGARCTPERNAIRASGPRLTRDQRTSASPSRSVTWPAIRSTRTRPRISISSGTPLDTTVRYWPRAGECPVRAPRSKIQCASEPSSAASGIWKGTRSKRRGTLT